MGDRDRDDAVIKRGCRAVFTNIFARDIRNKSDLSLFNVLTCNVVAYYRSRMPLCTRYNILYIIVSLLL